MIIGITGHTKGLGKAIYDTLKASHTIIGFSRTNGYNIQSPNKIIDCLKDCDVFINNEARSGADVMADCDKLAVWRCESHNIKELWLLAECP